MSNKIEYSKDLDKAVIMNTAYVQDEIGTLELYKLVDSHNYPVGTIHSSEQTQEIMQRDEKLLEIKFYHKESIKSLMQSLEYLLYIDWKQSEKEGE